MSHKVMRRAPGGPGAGLAALVVVLAAAAGAQTWKGPRVPRLTRHSGVVRLHSWRKGFLFENWVTPYQKSAYVGVGDWIALTGAGAQADVVFPDLTTILMRQAAEIQLLRVGGPEAGKGEHEIAIRDGLAIDVTLTETPTTLRLPGEQALRYEPRRAGPTPKVDLMFRFQRRFGRLRVKHARGEPLAVMKRGQVVRTLVSGQQLDFRLETDGDAGGSGGRPPAGVILLRVAGRQLEVPPGVVYRREGRRLIFTRDPARGEGFGLVRIDAEVVVVGRGSRVEVALR